MTQVRPEVARLLVMLKAEAGRSAMDFIHDQMPARRKIRSSTSLPSSIKGVAKVCHWRPTTGPLEGASGKYSTKLQAGADGPGHHAGWLATIILAGRRRWARPDLIQRATAL